MTPLPPLPLLKLKPGHVQPVWAGHPWVFAQAVAQREGNPQPGDEVLIADVKGNALGRGLYSPQSAIAARLFTRSAAEAIDEALFERKLRAAITRRLALGLPDDATTGVRWVHAEGDELPGLIVDRLGDTLCVQLGTIGLKRREGLLLDLLERLLTPKAIVDRSSARAAANEGFAPGSGVVRGDAQLTYVEFSERGLRFRVPLSLGQKTGFYLDQRPLRARVEALSRGRRVLDTYCYVGAIAMAAARGGAKEVVAVDSSAPALEVARHCAELNGLAGAVNFVEGDALAELSRAESRWDLVIVDPPKLAPTRAAQKRAAVVMRRLASAAARAVTEGGLVVLCSCSAAIGVLELTRALALGARDSGRSAIILEHLFQGPDHPVPAAFPEGLYLSTIIAEIRQL